MLVALDAIDQLLQSGPQRERQPGCSINAANSAVLGNNWKHKSKPRHMVEAVTQSPVEHWSRAHCPCKALKKICHTKHKAHTCLPLALPNSKSKCAAWKEACFLSNPEIKQDTKIKTQLGQRPHSACVALSAEHVNEVVWFRGIPRQTAVPEHQKNLRRTLSIFLISSSA